ncbi:hypothetical protein CAPTEDRAFT_168734 [Capitella teleta]|uniref:Vacuolar protein sorting-associated protein 16 homolog n=1 Tax=Capitella teleta TaxID=283909 RepID=R7VKD8_CAPTE|nr:hypothetical protein CAPTEDRAFT_168734 [Capitella teleta]|eukprot:ELU17286.1 hypothetical protein CAPTEDRAFT_168734 [Capitella teleta]
MYHFSRKHELYSMQWADKVDLSKFIIAAAPYGGPIALMRDDSKLQKSQITTKPIIYVFNAVGAEISAIRWNSGRVLKLAWSNCEDLLCIQNDGSVLVYDIFGSFKRTFSLGQEAKDVKIVECQVFSSSQGTGIAVLTSSYRFFVINNVEDPRIRRLAEVPGLNKPPSCWTMINQDRQSRALVARDNEIYLLDHGGQCEQQFPRVSGEVVAYVEMAASFNTRHIALFTSNGLLWIGSADLQKVYCEFNTKSPTRPQQLVWCGTGAVVGYWKNILLMVGLDKDWVKYSYDTPIHMVAEVDGLRIIGHESQEFLQKVPKVVEDICKIGSMAPGAMLFEASRLFQNGSQQADEYIHMIREKLNYAVEQCIEAAGREWEPNVQKQMLKAASFGKCFLTDYRPEVFYNMCQMLRVLNAVRDYKVSIPLTYMQLQNLTLDVLIDRLVVRRQYCLAIRICNYLRMPEAEGASRILAHWACYKVQQTNIEDEQIARAISQKLGDTPGVSYSEIANRAIECGRTELAIRLLDYEAKAAEQVPLLMKMKRDQLALTKAIESGDTDLVYTVLLHLQDTMPHGEFLMAIRNMDAAHSLYIQYCRDTNKNILQDIHYQEDNFFDGANCKVIDSYEEETMEARFGCLTSAQENFTKGKYEWAAKQTEEQIKLLRYQRRLEEEFSRAYLDLSLHETMRKLIAEGNTKVVEQMRKEFKVPDRRFWWLKVIAFSESGDFIELEKFSKSKKSPIGYEPFVEECMKQGNQTEAQKYLTRVSPEHRVQCYVRVGHLDQAAEIAFQQQSEDDLNYILSKCTNTNRGLIEKIQGMKSQMTSK